MDPWPTLADFKGDVDHNDIHYVLVGSAFASFGFGAGHPFVISPTMLRSIMEMIRHGGLHQLLSGGALQGGQSGPNAIDQWVQTHGILIPASAYGGTASGTLYYVSPATAQA
jgi:hypothetical protein